MDRPIIHILTPLDDVDEHKLEPQTLTDWMIGSPLQKVRFLESQRRRMLFRMLLLHTRHYIWSRRPVCNIDLVTLEPIADEHVFELTDTSSRCLFRFHRNNIYKAVLTNLFMSNEMVAEPRYPSNPYTNKPLTLAQTVSVCQRLVAMKIDHDSCPHPLLAAFWVARFDLQRFYTDNIAALSQHAIHSYFSDITESNVEVIRGTVHTFLLHTNYVTPTTAKWLDTTNPITLRDEWRLLCRDYFVYANLQVQSRPHWSSSASIYIDAWTLASVSFIAQSSSGGIARPSPMSIIMQLS